MDSQSNPSKRSTVVAAAFVVISVAGIVILTVILALGALMPMFKSVSVTPTPIVQAIKAATQATDVPTVTLVPTNTATVTASATPSNTPVPPAATPVPSTE